MQCDIYKTQCVIKFFAPSMAFWGVQKFRSYRSSDDERTFFRITIPCHEAAGNIIADIAHKDGSLKASKRGSLKTGLQSGLESRLKSGLKSGLKILEQIQNNPHSTLIELAEQTGYSRSWVAETMKRLQEQGIIKRVGSDRSGYWEIIG